METFTTTPTPYMSQQKIEDSYYEGVCAGKEMQKNENRTTIHELLYHLQICKNIIEKQNCNVDKEFMLKLDDVIQHNCLSWGFIVEDNMVRYDLLMEE